MMKKSNRYLRLSRAIKKVLAVGVSGLMLTPSTVWAETFISKPNEIRVGLQSAHKVCTFDFDSDGDLDIIFHHGSAITVQENIGSLTAPLFSPKKVIVDHIDFNDLPVKGLNRDDQVCELQYKKEVKIDIDHDGDLDLFKGRFFRDKGVLVNLFEFHEQTEEGLENANNTLGLPSTASTFAFVDIDKDGDDDIFIEGIDNFYENIGTPQHAAFVMKESPLKCDGQSARGGVVVDLNGDHQLDRACKDKTVILSSPDGYKKNNHLFQDSLNENFDRQYNRLTLDINQDNIPDLAMSFYNEDDDTIRDIKSGIPVFKRNSSSVINKALIQCGLDSPGAFRGLGFADFDSDKDFDFFAFDRFRSSIVYCKNNGSTDSPIYASAIDVPSLNDLEADRYGFIMGDMDGDGDQDLYVHNKFYDNIGSPEKPIFKHISHILHLGYSWLDLDNDGRVDSVLTGDGSGTFIFNKSLEPATSIAAKTYTTRDKYSSKRNKHIAIAVNRPSQVQLYKCFINSTNCNEPVLLPNTAKEIALSVGSFSQATEDDIEISLATVDEQDLINLYIYNAGRNHDKLKLISQGQGGKAHSIASSAGQLDNDPEDEIALTFIAENGKVLSAGVNFDMSIVGAALQGTGKNPSIAVGKFSDTSGSYVLSYITPDNQLKISTIQGDGTIISQIDGGSASDAKVSKSTFVPTTAQDEYIVSTHQANGTSGLTGFLSDGRVLGQTSLGATQQPTIISRYSESKVSLGLVVSVIQADKKPAVIFLDNLGNILATGVGGKTAMAATVADGGNGNAILAYVDESGIPRWETFSADGVKQP